MPAGLVTLELNHDEVGVAVDAQQVDAAAGLVPVGELLGDHQHAGGDDLDLVAEQPLQLAALADAVVAEAFVRQLDEGVFCQLEDGHGG